MRRWASVVLMAACGLLCACGSYPRDPEGTLERIEEEHRLRIGMAELSGTERRLASQFVARVERASRSTAVPALSGPTEAMLAALDNGKVDMVIAEVAKDSPWVADVAVIEPIATRRLGDRVLGLSAIVRNGENRWVMLLEREARAMKDRP